MDYRRARGVGWRSRHRDCLGCPIGTGASHEVGQQCTHRIIRGDRDRVGHRPPSTSRWVCGSRTCLKHHMRHRGANRVGCWGWHGAVHGWRHWSTRSRRHSLTYDTEARIASHLKTRIDARIEALVADGVAQGMACREVHEIVHRLPPCAAVWVAHWDTYIFTHGVERRVCHRHRPRAVHGDGAILTHWE